MSSNYDLEPLTSPPWWPGVAALVALAIIILSLAFCHY